MTARGPVAVVGMEVTLPGAPDLRTYWHNLRHGVDAIEQVPAGRHDAEFHAPGPAGPERTYCHRGGFVAPVVPLDLRRYGIMPNSVAEMEPDQLLALSVAARAIDDAGGLDKVAGPERIGVVLGRGGYLSPALARYEQRVRTIPAMLRLLRATRPDLTDAELEEIRTAALDELGPHSPEATIGLVPNLTASRLANRLDLRGPAYTVDAACASSLVAVDHAMSELAGGRCDAVLAGGVHHCHDETLWSTFTELGALSATGVAAPLSTDADGLLIGEGSGVVVLKRLADAERDGNRIYAVLTGAGVAGDGRSASLFAPDSGGQSSAVRGAWREAGQDPAAPGSIGLIEAHGTGTRAGDEAELSTLNAVFGRPAGGDGRAVIGSVKSMIGHTMPAAGVASLVKVALALHHGVRLPTLHCAEPNPLLADSRFEVLAAAEPWPEQDGPRRAGVNAFGFGGINAHVVVEEHLPSRVPASVREPERMLRLAAPDLPALAALLDRPDEALFDLPVGDGPCRIGLPDATARRVDTARKLVARARGGGAGSWRGRGDVWFSTEPLLAGGRTAFVFPGLEAEFTPRCADVAAWLGRAAPDTAVEVGADLLAHADAVMDTSRLLVEGCARVGVHADASVGHSVGEWSAMAAAGMFGPAGSATDPAVLRSRFWPAGFPTPEVEFAALGCGATEAAERAAAHPPVVLSHDNAPRQSIVCGPADAVEALVDAARADGVVCRRLPFRSGLHTPAFGPMLAPFRALTESLPMYRPSNPVLSCASTEPFPDDPAQVRELYLRHLVEPVRFREAIERLYATGHRMFVLLGAGQVGTFVSETLGDRDHLVVAAGASTRDGLDQLRRVALAHWVEGGDPDIGALVTSRAPAGVATGTGPGVAVRFGVPPLRLAPQGLRVPAAAGAGVSHAAVSHAAGSGAAHRLSGALPDAVAAEFAAFRAETEASADAVLTALLAPPAPPAQPVPQPPVPRQGPEEHVARVEVSLTAMPHLRGHRFFRQRADWPEESDRNPIVPATAILDLAIEHATRRWPELAVSAVRDARFDRWLTAHPAQWIDVRLVRDGDQVDVTVGEHARLRLDCSPAAAAPAPGPVPADDVPPSERLGRVYGNRLMFHGPEYQGITEITGIGPGHARARLVVPPAPGALLDNVGQLLGVWMFGYLQEGLLAFPHRMTAVEFSGPLPAPGAQLDCLIRPVVLDEHTLAMDAELVHAGRVVTTIRGWQDVRLDCDATAHSAYAFPDTHRYGEAQPGGWTLLRERWFTSAARNLHAGAQLGAAERARYDELSPPRRRHWLLGRMAAKDAVRDVLGVRLFPAELEIVNEDTGRPAVRGNHRADPAVHVSLAHSGPFGVAMATPAGIRPGIDVEPLRDPAPSTLDGALAAEERPLYERCAADGSGAWFSRFWTAKEAVAKALGSGLQGNPRGFLVLSIDEDGAEVRGPGDTRHRVAFASVLDGDRPFIVARTSHPDGRADTPAHDPTHSSAHNPVRLIPAEQETP